MSLMDGTGESPILPNASPGCSLTEEPLLWEQAGASSNLAIQTPTGPTGPVVVYQRPVMRASPTGNPAQGMAHEKTKGESL